MKPITETTVARMCREMTSRPSLSASMDYLEAHQPDVLHYLVASFLDARREAGMKACQLGWCVYRSFELEGGQPIRRISKQELIEKAQANQSLLAGTAGASLDEFLEVMSLEFAAQPVVMQLVREAVAEGLSNDLPQDRERLPELVAIFLAVKTVVDALDAATN